MDLAVPCPTCNSITPCECQQAVASYFKLLSEVSGRVLRSEAASKVGHLPVARAGIDKLNGMLAEPVKIDEILARCQLFACSQLRRVLKDRRPYLEISRENKCIQLRVCPDKEHVLHFVSNPNQFSNWNSYAAFIQDILTPAEVRRARITRLDLNLDFSSPFKTVIQAIDIKNKRTGIHFNDQSGQRTGLIIGKGAETIEIYDKAKKEGLDSPLTRIEQRLTQRKLPTRSISEVPAMMASSSYFKGIEGLAVSFVGGTTTDLQSSRLKEFRLILEREGLHVSRKVLNQHRNFDRNFAKLLKIERWDNQPSTLFEHEIKSFLNDPDATPSFCDGTPQVLGPLHLIPKKS